MASWIPQTARRPPGGNRRGSFWLGVLVGAGVLLGANFALNFYLNVTYGGGIGGGVYSGMSMECDQPQVTLLIEGGRKSVGYGESKVWKIVDPKFGWSCGEGSFARTMTCKEGTEHLLVMRYLDSDWLEIRCWVPTSTKVRQHMLDG